MKLPSRRSFLLALAAAAPAPRGFFFSTQRRMAMMQADGSGLRYFEFDRPGQASWQPGPYFPGGRRIIVLSFEAGPAFTGKVPSHIWIHDLQTGALDEIVPRERLAPYYVPVLLLPKQERLLVSIILNGESRLFSMSLDGRDQREITRAGEGFSYGFSLSPDENAAGVPCRRAEAAQLPHLHQRSRRRAPRAGCRASGSFVFWNKLVAGWRLDSLSGLPFSRRTPATIGRISAWAGPMAPSIA